MNPSRRAVLAAVLAILALGATASVAVAASPTWVVNGKFLEPGATKAIAESTTVKENFSIRSSSWEVSCTSLKVPGSVIEGERTRRDPGMVLEGCAVSKPAKCTVSTIKFAPLTSTLEGTTGHFKLNFKPTSGTTVTTIKLSGAECIVSSIEVTGTMACNYPGVETEAHNHILEFSLTSGSELKFGGGAVKLTGQDEFWLNPNELWGVA
jgi:hypothetical protein